MKKLTACPLDCYDSCVIDFSEDKIKAYKKGYTNGFLCSHLNHYTKFPTIQKARYNEKEIELDEALNILKDMLRDSNPNQILHYRGSGNFGLMQEVVDHFFASFNATLTDGSLCDGAGEAGIVASRGKNVNMTPDEIAKSDVVIFWGRNPHTTSSHLLPIIKDKTIIVIDPIKTQIAKEAHLHIQLKPHGDYVLAMLLSRFLHIHGDSDEEFLKEYASEYEDFYELTQSIRIKASLEQIDVTLGEVGKLLGLIKDKKVAIVVGVGVQKYKDGADILRAIDAFAMFLGAFNKEGCGVSYLGSSKANIVTPFNTKAKRVSKVDTLFSNYKTVFIQGANPLQQMPNTTRVKNSLKNVENIIYFGLYENQTSKVANLVIPAKSFLYKDDVRTSYSHNGFFNMPKLLDTDIGISEYDLAKELCDEFNIELKTQDEYLEHFRSFAKKIDDDLFEVKNRDTKQLDDEFEFLDEYDNDFNMSDDLFLVTPKSKNSLNSQFRCEDSIYLNPKLGFNEGESVKVESIVGSAVFKVKLSSDVREDCVLIYSGTNEVNNLTTSKHSYEGKNAVFQELKVKVSSI